VIVPAFAPAIRIAWAVALLLLLPLKDARPGRDQNIYDRAWNLFQHGRLADSQREAEAGYWQLRIPDPVRASKLQLLEAETLVWRGLNDEALETLARNRPVRLSPEDSIEELAIEGVAYAGEKQFLLSQQRFSQGASLCKNQDYTACGDVLRGQGVLASKQGEIVEARKHFLDTLGFARAHHDRLLEASAYLNLGWVAMQQNRFDEALDWSRGAYDAAVELGAEDKAQRAEGNLGWAYFQLGDDERALEQYLEAETSASKLGNVRNELNWISTAGYIYRDNGDLAGATRSYRQALGLAKQISSKEDTINALEDLADISVDSGKLSEASAYIDEVTPMELAGGDHLSANVLLTEGKLAAARRQNKVAESFYRQVQNDVEARTTTRLTAGYELGQLFELEGNMPAAEKSYKATLDEFDSARQKLKSEESKLPFLANAANIYDDYIQLLVREGRSEEALELADQSRARTLAQALDGSEGKTVVRPPHLSPGQIATKTGATLLFYWLGQEQSYLWVITPLKITLFPLAPQKAIREQVERYNTFLLSYRDPIKFANQDGQALYKLLIAPASSLIRGNAPVMVLADGALSQLNFETLLAPGPGREDGHTSSTNGNPHYWIEDATVLSAPSLAMLAASKPARDADPSLLLLGDPVSPSDDFPTLPLFGFEMTRIKKHFAAQHISAFDGAKATPLAYLSSNPSHYSYIHFVSHAVASRTDPLDSAIILSDSKPGEDSFKLYARDIMQHPIHARLVTISACYGSGTRSYAGEGLVGLSWAFLRAGAQSVIGSLWEVSDDSTPKLMDKLYAGIENRQTPAVALRNAKLDLIHAQNRFSAPFYWAPFQLYTTQ
jgi:CHAT domain-containing protein/Tfp pilus assembly protein PilF